MSGKNLEEMYHLTTAQWPYWFCVVAPDPWANEDSPTQHNGVCYPSAGQRLYTNIEALGIMRKLAERGISSRAVGPHDDYTLADEKDADRQLDRIEAQDESRQPARTP